MKHWIACLTVVAACSHPAAVPTQPPPPPETAAEPPEAAPAQVESAAKPPAPEAAPENTAPAAPAPLAPPPKTLAAIDVFGAKRVSNEELIATAGFVVGSPVAFGSQEFGEQLEAATQRLKERYRFAFVDVSPISYFGSSPDAGKVFITIDVVEAEDAGRLKFAPEPAKDIPDPDGLVAAWLDYEKAVWALQRSGEAPPRLISSATDAAEKPDLVRIRPDTPEFVRSRICPAAIRTQKKVYIVSLQAQPVLKTNPGEELPRTARRHRHPRAAHRRVSCS
jgi:hypothetical protein